MADGRRARWIAFDAHFLDGPLGMAIIDRFGPVGVTLFLGFLCACKKNHIQGQITYGSEAEALAIMGLAGVELLDAKGESFDLDSFWTLLGRRKQITRTSRGRRLNTVRSSKWTKWQQGYAHQKEAERKATSRAGNTADDTPDDPPPPLSGNDAITFPETDIETDLETDIVGTSTSDLHPANGDVGMAACKLLAEAEADRRNDIRSRSGWVSSRARSLYREHQSEIARILVDHADPPPSKLAAFLNGNRNAFGATWMPGTGYLTERM